MRAWTWSATGVFLYIYMQTAPTLSTPFRILPPATPPFKSSTSQPGLFTSNDLMTKINEKHINIFTQCRPQSVNLKSQDKLKLNCSFVPRTNEPGLWRKVSDWHWDFLDDVLAHHLNVVLELRWDGNDGSPLCNGTCRRNLTIWEERPSLLLLVNEVQVHWLTLHERQDLLILLFGLTFLHKVDLVLQDEDVLELHDLYSCQVLRSLGLRTRLVTRCEEKKLSFRDTY